MYVEKLVHQKMTSAILTCNCFLCHDLRSENSGIKVGFYPAVAKGFQFSIDLQSIGQTLESIFRARRAKNRVTSELFSASHYLFSLSYVTFMW